MAERREGREGVPETRVARAADRVLGLLTPERNAGGIVYGLTMIGAVLAVESYRNGSGEALASGALTICVYWLAHAHATAIGERMGERRRIDVRALLDGLRHDWPIVRGGMLPLLALAIAWAAGASEAVAAGVAVWSSVAMLIGIELLIGLSVQAGVKGMLLEGAVGFTLGVAVIGLELLLH